MTTLPLLLSVCLALVGYSRFAYAAYDDACFTDSDCTAGDNTMCTSAVPGCLKGKCNSCKTNYVSTGTACLLDFGQTCSVAGDCATGTCSTTCACAGGSTWDSTYKACVTDNKAWGDACASNPVDVDVDCFVNAANGGACTGTAGSEVCDCATGYTKTIGYTCEKPYYGESCNTGVGCQSRGNTGEVEPVCTSGTCVCDVTEEVTTYNGVSFCSTIVTAANKKKSTLTCAAHNECENGMCVECPTTASGFICACENSSSMIKPMVALVISSIVGFLYF